jgi:hypothetical protein
MCSLLAGSAGALTGGPDDFGYTFTDNTEAGGPTYSWVEINETGTEITDWTNKDDGYAGPISIGFNFTFYGTKYDELYVGTNGYISFGQGYGDIPWDTLPNTNDPNNDIMVFGRDLYLYPGVSHVYHQNLTSPTRFVVEFINVQRCCGLNINHTFEIILYENGDILTLCEAFLLKPGSHISFVTSTFIYP